MAIWAILAAPLMMSNKLSAVRPEFKEILQNREVIRVNQDSLGIQGVRVFKVGLPTISTKIFRKEILILYIRFQDQGIDIWTRPIEPTYHGQYSYAVAFISHRADGTPYLYEIKLKELGLEHQFGYTVKVQYKISFTYYIRMVFYTNSNFLIIFCLV